jgi:hypothetical protein
MQTTLRIDDALYRKAKARAASLGISLTQLFEEALRAKLRERSSPRRRMRVRLPVSSAKRGPDLFNEKLGRADRSRRSC